MDEKSYQKNENVARDETRHVTVLVLSAAFNYWTVIHSTVSLYGNLDMTIFALQYWWIVGNHAILNSTGLVFISVEFRQDLGSTVDYFCVNDCSTNFTQLFWIVLLNDLTLSFCWESGRLSSVVHLFMTWRTCLLLVVSISFNCAKLMRDLRLIRLLLHD